MSQSQVCLDCSNFNVDCTCVAAAGADVINPEHYKTDGLECIDAIRAALGEEGFKAFCRGNVIKYAWRESKKETEPNEDMKKSAWYASMAAGVDPRPNKTN